MILWNNVLLHSAEKVQVSDTTMMHKDIKPVNKSTSNKTSALSIIKFAK